MVPFSKGDRVLIIKTTTKTTFKTRDSNLTKSKLFSESQNITTKNVSSLLKQHYFTTLQCMLVLMSLHKHKSKCS